MKIGSIEIDNPLALAPMEDVTDIPFRLIAKRLDADLVYTEFSSSEGIIRQAKRVMDKIEIVDEERPVGIQIFGGVEESMERATQIAGSHQPDLIDINCGCWVKNHALHGVGAGLLRDLPLFERIVKATVKASQIPVTVKTRLGWDEKNIVILDVAQMVEQCGAKALTLHCRTRSQGHEGRADWSWLTKIKKVIRIPVFGNGDVMTPQDVQAMFQTGCDGVMIGRGALHNPWLFRQAKHYLKTRDFLPPPTVKERIDLCIEHLQLSVQHKGLRLGVIEFRKYYSGYLHGLPNVSRLKNDLMQIIDFQEIIDRLYQFLEESSSIRGQIPILNK